MGPIQGDHGDEVPQPGSCGFHPWKAVPEAEPPLEVLIQVVQEDAVVEREMTLRVAFQLEVVREARPHPWRLDSCALLVLERIEHRLLASPPD